jgi:hypothetical protein
LRKGNWPEIFGDCMGFVTQTLNLDGYCEGRVQILILSKVVE